LEKLRIESPPSLWANYDTDFVFTDRFKKINSILQNIPGQTVLDIGGNTGAFASYFLASSTKCLSYTVLDSDLSSLEIGIKKLEVEKGRLHFAYFNFAQPWVSANSEPYWERFSSDIVIMLAVTHHLVLTEHMTFRQIFARLQKLTRKFLLIEFMPLGLWYTGIANNSVTDNYLEENFVAAMNDSFIIVDRIELEPNRILFIGRKLE
jgi:hypothetical protein